VSYADIQAKIVARLQTIQGIAGGAGQVRTCYQRAITPEDFESLFQVEVKNLETTKPINAWLVVYERATPSKPDSLQSLIVEHEFAIVGFQSYNQNSDAAIRELANRILDSFSLYLTLGMYGANIDTIVEDSSIAIENFSHYNLGPVLCSRADLRITAVERRVPVTWEA